MQPPKRVATSCKPSLTPTFSLPPLQFDAFMTPAALARRQTLARPPRPWQMSAVYLDNYILAAVESPDGNTLDRVGRAALHATHGLFPHHQSSRAMKGAKTLFPFKKLEAGNARWAHYQRAPV